VCMSAADTAATPAEAPLQWCLLEAGHLVFCDSLPL